MKKICSVCTIEKSLNEFYRVNKYSESRRAACIECTSTGFKRNYSNKKDKYKARTRNKWKEAGILLRNNVLDYLLNNPCVDCGEPDPLVLQFDHIAGIKSMDVCKMMRHYVAWSKLKAEIDKCAVRCANCHERKTARARNYWKVKLLDEKILQIPTCSTHTSA